MAAPPNNPAAPGSEDAEVSLGVFRPDGASYSLRPSPATRLHLSKVKAFGVPSADGFDTSDPYAVFELLEGPQLPAPSVRTQALSNATDPVWSDQLHLMLAEGSVRPPLLRIAVWDTSFSRHGLRRDEDDTLLGSTEVRLADLSSGTVLDLSLAGERGLPGFTMSFAFRFERSMPRRLTLFNVSALAVPESRSQGHASEPFMRFSLGAAPGLTRQTAPAPSHSFSATWRDELHLDVPADVEGPIVLRVEVLAHDWSQGDELLCAGEVALEPLPRGSVWQRRVEGVQAARRDCMFGLEYALSEVVPPLELRLSRVRAFGVPRTDQGEGAPWVSFYLLEDATPPPHVETQPTSYIHNPSWDETLTLPLPDTLAAPPLLRVNVAERDWGGAAHRLGVAEVRLGAEPKGRVWELQLAWRGLPPFTLSFKYEIIRADERRAALAAPPLPRGSQLQRCANCGQYAPQQPLRPPLRGTSCAQCGWIVGGGGPRPSPRASPRTAAPAAAAGEDEMAASEVEAAAAAAAAPPPAPGGVAVSPRSYEKVAAGVRLEAVRWHRERLATEQRREAEELLTRLSRRGVVLSPRAATHALCAPRERAVDECLVELPSHEARGDAARAAEQQDAARFLHMLRSGKALPSHRRRESKRRSASGAADAPPALEASVADPATMAKGFGLGFALPPRPRPTSPE